MQIKSPLGLGATGCASAAASTTPVVGCHWLCQCCSIHNPGGWVPLAMPVLQHPQPRVVGCHWLCQCCSIHNPGGWGATGYASVAASTTPASRIPSLGKALL